MTIRPAVVSDVPSIVAMAEQFVRETPYAAHLVLSPSHVMQLAERLILSDDGVVLVAEDRGEPVGMVALQAFEHPMSGQRVAAEFAWWVNPHHRGSIGVRLLHAAEHWAIVNGATALQMIAPDPRVGQLYARAGYHALETTFQKRIA
jgi:predicted N-acetyltransferase YhbS